MSIKTKTVDRTTGSHKKRVRIGLALMRFCRGLLIGVLKVLEEADNKDYLVAWAWVLLLVLFMLVGQIFACWKIVRALNAVTGWISLSSHGFYQWKN